MYSFTNIVFNPKGIAFKSINGVQTALIPMSFKLNGVQYFSNIQVNSIDGLLGLSTPKTAGGLMLNRDDTIELALILDNTEKYYWEYMNLASPLN